MTRWAKMAANMKVATEECQMAPLSRGVHADAQMRDPIR
jgi:hypothetical protein